jgi:hypothetical protein
MVMILGIAFCIMVGANVTFSLTKPKQDLLITNTGSQSVDIVNASAPWWDRKVLTLHAGMSFICIFRDGDQFRITRSAEKPPKPGTTPPASPLPPRSESLRTALTHNVDGSGSGTIVIKHAFRTADVRVNEAGKIEFEFTDL